VVVVGAEAGRRGVEVVTVAAVGGEALVDHVEPAESESLLEDPAGVALVPFGVHGAYLISLQ
jgi:hypothetical protein